MWYHALYRAWSVVPPWYHGGTTFPTLLPPVKTPSIDRFDDYFEVGCINSRIEFLQKSARSDIYIIEF